MPGRIVDTRSNNGDDSSSSDGESGTHGRAPNNNGGSYARRYYTQETRVNANETTPINTADDRIDGHRRRREELSNQFIEAESSTDTTDQSSIRARQHEVISEMDYHRGMEDLIETGDAGWHESDEPDEAPFESHDPSAQAAELISRISRVQEHPQARAAWETRLQERTRHYELSGITPLNMDDDQRRDYYSILTQLTQEIYEEYHLGSTSTQI